MSLGRLFHKTIARGRKLMRVDVLRAAGTRYPDFRKEYPEVEEAKLGTREHRYGGARFSLILKKSTSVKKSNLCCNGGRRTL